MSSISIRLIQSTTECSVFDRFCFSCVVYLFMASKIVFHESMASKIVYKPWRSWNTVGLTPI